MDGLCVLLISLLGAVVVAYLLLELHYFVRMALCVLSARLFGKRLHILETTTFTGICITTDLDTLFYHMNNARYLREIDFARVDFYERTQLYRTIVRHGGGVVQGASTIRYRRFIRPFRTFRITSRIVYWDEQSIYMEHRFVSPRDGFVHCVVLCRQRVINCSAEAVLGELLQRPPTSCGAAAKVPATATTVLSADNGTVATSTTIVGATTVEIPAGKSKPELTPDLAKWIEYNEMSSALLRPPSSHAI